MNAPSYCLHFEVMTQLFAIHRSVECFSILVHQKLAGIDVHVIASGDVAV